MKTLPLLLQKFSLQNGMITPYQAHHNCITSKINNTKLVFPFLEKSKTRNLNLIKACSIHTYHINALIHGKQFHLHDL
jgi:hypothetical protein